MSGGKQLLPLEGPPPGTVGPGTPNTLAMFTGVTAIGDSFVREGTNIRGDFVTTPARLFVGDPPIGAPDPWLAQIGFVNPTRGFTRVLELMWGDGTQALQTPFLEGIKMELNPVTNATGSTFLGIALANAVYATAGGDWQRVWSLSVNDVIDASVPNVDDYKGLQILSGDSGAPVVQFATGVEVNNAFSAVQEQYGVRVRGTGSAPVLFSFFADAATGIASFADGLIAAGLKYPLVDGAAGDVVTTDGAGNLTLQPGGGGTPSGWAEVPNVGVNLVTVTQTLLRAVIGAPDLTDQFNVDSSLNIDHVDPTGTYGRYNYINIGSDFSTIVTGTTSANGIVMFPTIDVTAPGGVNGNGIYVGFEFQGVGTLTTWTDLLLNSGSVAGVAVTQWTGIDVSSSGFADPITTAVAILPSLRGSTGTNGWAIQVPANAVTGFTVGLGAQFVDSRVVIGNPNLADLANYDASLNVDHILPTTAFSGEEWPYINIGGNLGTTVTGDVDKIVGVQIFTNITSPINLSRFCGVHSGAQLNGPAEYDEIIEFLGSSVYNGDPGNDLSLYLGVDIRPSLGGAGGQLLAYTGFQSWPHANITTNRHDFFAQPSTGTVGSNAFAFFVAAGYATGVMGAAWGLYLTDSNARFGAQVHLDNNVDGAGAGLGTLTTAPHVGNPDAWLEVWRNGVQGWLPWWHA